MRLSRWVLVAGLGAVAALGVSGALCRFAVDCHLRSLPLLSRLAHEPPVLEGVHQRGTGQTTLAAGFRQEVVASGLNLPTSFAELPDGRFLVAEKDGLVRVVEDGRVLARPFVDLRPVVDSTGIRGLVSVEASPDFDRTGFVYLLYARQLGPGRRTLLLTRVTAQGDEASRGSEEVILGANRQACGSPQPPRDCLPLEGDHQGGELEFLDDGTMFVSLGEGGGEERGAPPNAFRAQDLDSLSGKLLRVTPDGEGVPSNPFWDGNPRSNRSRVWAYGLRNPFRMALRPGSAVPVVGELGLNGFDELVVGAPGANYGWPCYEGRERQRVEGYRGHRICAALYARGADAVEPPLLAYPSASVTGGAFYTGTTYPSRYRGAYFYGDWAKSWLRYLPAGELSSPRTPTPRDFAENAGGPVQIELGSDGNLLYLALNAGELRRIVHAGT
ncbi:MAG: PQQ-dependent sugar dehydrogenase [Actinomycetota bacterium]|nr:PQQ-dependent sugar dehydrogenase [Actinomycetota bacterium]